MRVLLLSSAYPPTIGGAETYALNLRRGLERCDVEIAVFTDTVDEQVSRDNDPYVKRASHYRTLLEAQDKVRWEQMYFSLLPELATIAEEFCPDIIHANSHEGAILGSIAGVAAGTPVVATFHEQSPERTPLGRGRCTLVYKHLPLACIVAGSRYYYEKALAHGAHPDRLELVHHGIDLDRFSPSLSGVEQRRRWRLEENDIVILCAARISPRKGQLELTRAFAAVGAAVPNARLVLAGSCHSGSEVYLRTIEAEIDASHMTERIRIDGSIAQDEMPWAYAAADIVVQPSKEEGLGLALIEAMACQRPVVGFDVVGIREVITSDQVGILVPGGEPEHLVEPLVALCQEPGRRVRLGEAARNHVVKHFPLDRMAAATKDVYTRILTR